MSRHGPPNRKELSYLELKLRHLLATYPGTRGRVRGVAGPTIFFFNGSRDCSHCRLCGAPVLLARAAQAEQRTCHEALELEEGHAGDLGLVSQAACLGRWRDGPRDVILRLERTFKKSSSKKHGKVHALAHARCPRALQLGASQRGRGNCNLDLSPNPAPGPHQPPPPAFPAPTSLPARTRDRRSTPASAMAP